MIHKTKNVYCFQAFDKAMFEYHVYLLQQLEEITFRLDGNNRKQPLAAAVIEHFKVSSNTPMKLFLNFLTSYDPLFHFIFSLCVITDSNVSSSVSVGQKTDGFPDLIASYIYSINSIFAKRVWVAR